MLNICKAEFLSGIFEGKSSGTPIGFTIYNQDHNSKDYSHLQDNYRPSHADYTYDVKYGIRDYRGGGRSSARETIARVVAGAIAKQVLQVLGVDLYAYVSSVGEVDLDVSYDDLDLSKIEGLDSSINYYYIERLEQPIIDSNFEEYIKLP